METDGGQSHGVVALGDSWLTGYGLPLAGLSCLSWAGWLAWAVCTGLQKSCDVVAIATLPAAMRTPDLSWRANVDAVHRINDSVREAAAATGVVLVELQDALTGTWAMAPDRQHPTSLGQLEAAHVAAGSLSSVTLLRALPDPADRTLPTVQKRLYDVSIRDRVRGGLVSLRQRERRDLSLPRRRPS
ncbi:MAG: hypothetical protein JWO88_995 [Frankiales bacterium]|nr:hypothetical protein [Frankiales bacterium]